MAHYRCEAVGVAGYRIRGRFLAGPSSRRPDPGTISGLDEVVAGVKDADRCGPGTDTVYVDNKDVVSADCERVRIR